MSWERAESRLARLFAGRTDAWGAVHGESVRLPLTVLNWNSHVNGEGSVGVYPLLDNGTVRWGCVDVDDGYEASLPIARNLHKAYNVLGLTSWIERTKGKGYHVWLLCSDWVPAVQMRAVQLLACQLIDYRPREINPKQTALQDGALGNYVNIPYAKQWADQCKRVVLFTPHPGQWANRCYTLDEFLDEAEARLNTPAKIAEVAALYREPPKPKAPVHINHDDRHLDTEKLSALTRKVYNEGPLAHPETGHIDRSAGLQRLAHLCAADGLNPTETFQVILRADMRWGKYCVRKDGVEQMERIVERAYYA